jgi:hypothetical protein
MRFDDAAVECENVRVLVAAIECDSASQKMLLDWGLLLSTLNGHDTPNSPVIADCIHGTSIYL